MTSRRLSAIEKILLGRAARELRQGMFVNLGIGLPQFLPEFIPKAPRTAT